MEERSYVDYVTCFKMFHIVHEDPTNNPNDDVDEAIATTSVSIIGSADNHEVDDIEAIEATEVYSTLVIPKDRSVVKLRPLNVRTLKAITDIKIVYRQCLWI